MQIKKRETLNTDILIIGGGTAGCYAALTIAEKSGYSVLIAEKANIKRSGCLAAGVNAINAYVVEGRKPEDYVDYAKKDADGIVREDLLLTMSEGLNRVALTANSPSGIEIPDKIKATAIITADILLNHPFFLTDFFMFSPFPGIKYYNVTLLTRDSVKNKIFDCSNTCHTLC